MSSLIDLKSANVTVTAVRTVKAGDPSSLSQAPTRLGPLDSLVFPFIPIAVVYVYRNETPGTELVPIYRLQQALERVLDYYPHLTGRLHIDAANGLRSYTSLGTGAELLMAECQSPLPTGTFTLLDLPDAGNALLPAIETSLDEFLKKPILSIKHTRFGCGGVGLGIRLPHACCDGEGFFQFVGDLAEVYRTGALSQPPHIQPFLANLAETMSPDERFSAPGFQPELYTTDLLPEPPPTETLPPVAGRVIRFSDAALASLKQKHVPKSGWISKFDALTAHLYDRVRGARERAGLPPLANVIVPVNLRPAGRLGLPERYFHNALLLSWLPVEGPTAETVHSLAPRAIPRALAIARWSAAQPNHARIRFTFPGGFSASQWARFDIYGGAALDDGCTPVLVAPPFTAISNVDMLAYYLPIPQETPGGGLDVYLPLLKPVWNELEQDEEWLQCLSAGIQSTKKLACKLVNCAFIGIADRSTELSRRYRDRAPHNLLVRHQGT